MAIRLLRERAEGRGGLRKKTYRREGARSLDIRQAHGNCRQAVWRRGRLFIRCRTHVSSLLRSWKARPHACPERGAYPVFCRRVGREKESAMYQPGNASSPCPCGSEKCSSSGRGRSGVALLRAGRRFPYGAEMTPSGRGGSTALLTAHRAVCSVSFFLKRSFVMVPCALRAPTGSAGLSRWLRPFFCLCRAALPVFRGRRPSCRRRSRSVPRAGGPSEVLCPEAAAILR